VKQPAGLGEHTVEKVKDNGGHISFLLPISLLPLDELNGL
jgi:hypothetical protein